MTVAFGRVCVITAYHQRGSAFVGAHPSYFEELGNGIEIRGGKETEHRIQFTVNKNLGAEPNTAEVTITNLSEHTRSELQRLPVRVRIEAGHDNAPRFLFVGDVQPGSQSKIVGSDWETKLLLGDGSRAFANARINRSYRPGTPTRTILRDAAAAMGLTLPREVEATAMLRAQLATGEALTGWASDELARLLAPFGYSYSIQNGRLQILRDEDTRQDTARLVDADNGPLLGSPALGTPDKSGKPPTMTLQTLLYPELTPGGRVDVRSRSLNGVFKIARTKHQGDTHGDQWETEVEAQPPGKNSDFGEALRP